MAIAPPPPTQAGPSPVPPQLPPGYELKKKKGHKLRNIVLGTAAIIVVAVVATSASNSNSGTKVSSGGGSTGTSQSATPSKFAVGDTIKVGDNMLFSVTGVKDNVASGNQFETPKNGQFLVVNVSLQNKGTQPSTISSLVSFELRDENGQSYTETILNFGPEASGWGDRFWRQAGGRPVVRRAQGPLVQALLQERPFLGRSGHHRPRSALSGQGLNSPSGR